MSEYIKREALLEHKTLIPGFVGEYVSVDRIKEACSTDVVEVVRCKDCNYIRPDVDAYTHEVVGWWCSLIDLGSIEAEHFCSYGDRRGNNG